MTQNSRIEIESISLRLHGTTNTTLPEEKSFRRILQFEEGLI